MGLVEDQGVVPQQPPMAVTPASPTTAPLPLIAYGDEYVPPGSVVVSGSLPAADGSHSLYCAVIVKQVDEKTRSKTSVNELLRGLAD